MILVSKGIRIKFRSASIDDQGTWKTF
ncbi:uncharacterized protein METZ01_LOCUS297608 [marine metagenome]|uniref:Uncharacterized protein n=1 Tax=marine metagenome TaxID=408172 RepID=A0A382M6T8_9ZZZZ